MPCFYWILGTAWRFPIGLWGIWRGPWSLGTVWCGSWPCGIQPGMFSLVHWCWRGSDLARFGMVVMCSTQRGKCHGSLKYGVVEISGFAYVMDDVTLLTWRIWWCGRWTGPMTLLDTWHVLVTWPALSPLSFFAQTNQVNPAWNHEFCPKGSCLIYPRLISSWIFPGVHVRLVLWFGRTMRVPSATRSGWCMLHAPTKKEILVPLVGTWGTLASSTVDGFCSEIMLFNLWYVSNLEF